MAERAELMGARVPAGEAPKTSIEAGDAHETGRVPVRRARSWVPLAPSPVPYPLYPTAPRANGLRGGSTAVRRDPLGQVLQGVARAAQTTGHVVPEEHQRGERRDGDEEENEAVFDRGLSVARPECPVNPPTEMTPGMVHKTFVLSSRSGAPRAPGCDASLTARPLSLTTMLRRAQGGHSVQAGLRGRLGEAFREAVSGIITGVPGGGHVYGRADAPTRRLLYPERQPNGQALPAARARGGHRRSGQTLAPSS